MTKVKDSLYQLRLICSAVSHEGLTCPPQRIPPVNLELPELQPQEQVGGNSGHYVVELFRRIEVRRIIHRNLDAETTIAEIRPITDLAVSKTN